jgi:hypothetical protein
VNFLSIESERVILEYNGIVGIDTSENKVKKEKPDDSDEETLYKNEFRVQKLKKLRIEEFPQVLDL